MADAKYVLMPCSGRARLNIPRGHVYEVLDASGGRKTLGYIRLEDAPCPLCGADIDEKFRMKVIKPAQ